MSSTHTLVDLDIALVAMSARKGSKDACVRAFHFSNQARISTDPQMLSEMLGEAIFDLLQAERGSAQIEALHALLGLGIAPALQIEGRNAVMSKAVDYAVMEAIPLLHDAGFTLDDTPNERENVANTLGGGLWIHPDLIMPGLAATPEIGEIVTGAWIGIEQRIPSQRLVDNLKRVAEWIGPVDVSVPFSQAFKWMMDRQTGFYDDVFLGGGRDPVPVIVQLMRMGMDHSVAAEALAKKKNEGVMIERVLNKALMRKFEEDTSSATRPATKAVRL